MANVPVQTISPYYKPQPSGNWGSGNYGASAAQAAVGTANMVGNWVGMAKQTGGLETNAPYGGGYQGSWVNRGMNFDPQRTSFGEIAAGAAQGAAAGSSFGPIGTAIGTGVGAIGTAIGGRARYNRQKEAHEETLSNIASYQKRFKEESEQQESQQIGEADYRRRMTNNYNFYS
jgi:hypothetical protein